MIEEYPSKESRPISLTIFNDGSSLYSTYTIVFPTGITSIAISVTLF
jgi:hypothetical protein